MQVFKHSWLSAFLVSMVIGLAIALVGAVLGRGSFAQVVIHILVAVWGVPLLLLIALVAGVLWWRGQRWATRLIRGAIAATLGVIVQLGGVVLGVYLANKDVAQAKAYCEQLVPKLQTYRDTHGQYPEAIANLENPPPLPRLLRDESFYYGDKEDFSFTIDDPTALFGAWQYNSRELTWQYLN
ncbi:hypothetical protein H6G89_01705 [Oscillatoria sp. FACHB-1407]|uniref:hypothetical protein n=1 Tax=Oscillatoria sp. FACHB-1407 TaxID=2692847 RepID=UPI001684D40C|nr:hypothetical protein [Oscillatoria sp. FACHB-1407]MBD2459747.1 hypothetical protein [Oscillatoria sp. FACHB-1407]